VASLVEDRRLSEGDAAKRRFRVSRQEALERLRERPLEEPWDWLLGLVRAAKLASPEAAARIRRYDDPGKKEHVVTELTFVVPGAELEGLVLDDLLSASLGAGQPSVGGDEEPGSSEFHRRWRQLVGEALNLALGLRPHSLELRTPVGGLAFLPGSGSDLPRGRALPGEGESCFVVRVSTERPSIGSIVGKWFTGEDELPVRLARRWSTRIVGAREPRAFDLSKGMPLGVQHPQYEFELGGHARMGWTPGAAGAPLDTDLWLVREGVRVAELGPALTREGLDMPMLRGWIDCPTLELTADESTIVKNGAFDLLVAWLREYTDRAREETSYDVHWPMGAQTIRTCSGREISIAELERWAADRHELVYVYHRRTDPMKIPSRLASRIASLWPSEVEMLRREFPGIRPLPLRALGAEPQLEPTDLASLEQGSLDTLQLARDVVIEPSPANSAWSLRLEVIAYIHRYPHAVAGTVVVLSYGRRLAQLRDPAVTIAGVTLLCHVSRPGEGALDITALRADALATAAIAARAKEIAQAHRESLLSHVMGRRNPWDIPFTRVALEELAAVTIHLRYVESGDAVGGLQLAWRDTALLDVRVATTHGGEGRTLRDALERLRDAGLIVVAERGARWKTLESDDPNLQPWVLESSTRALLERVLGPAALLHMPAVPEVYPLVRLASEQRALIREADALNRDVERIGKDGESRARLIGHLLVARALARPTHGLETLPLFLRYDPRALSPTQWVSLEALAHDSTRPGLVPMGAVSRSLAGPVIEVSPGVALLLVREGFAPVVTVEGQTATPVRAARSLVAPIRKRARALRPLLHRSVVHTLAVGSLQVAGDGNSQGIALWAQGLRVGEVELPEPLGRVSGRLWLTQSGQRASRAQLQAAVLGLARELIAGALHQKTLLSPRGKRRERLGHFINYARGIVVHDDPHALAAGLGLRRGRAKSPGEAAAKLLEVSLRAVPLEALPEAPAARFASLLRQSLGLALHIDTASLSWRVLEVQGRRSDGAFRVELGRRSEWIQETLAGKPDTESCTTVLAIAHFHHGAALEKTLKTGPEYRTVAYLRFLTILAASRDA
jgi:hypothetical protein